MRVSTLVAVVIMGTVPAALSGQDTSANAPRRAAELRQMIDQRFGERLKEDLGLSDEQAAKLRGVQASVAEKRRMLQTQEQQIRVALGYQLRPGIAANADSVGKLVNALTAQRVVMAQTFQDEMRELSSFLSPVQRGQYLIMRDRLMMQVQEMRRGMPFMRSPQARPAPRPGRMPPLEQ